MEKLYYVYTTEKEQDYGDFIIAESANKAKQSAIKQDLFPDKRYIDLKCRLVTKDSEYYLDNTTEDYFKVIKEINAEELKMIFDKNISKLFENETRYDKFVTSLMYNKNIKIIKTGELF